MPDDKTDRDYIGECALHQNREGVLVNVYELSDEDRIALARMTTDARQNEETTRWIGPQPPEEL
jgi:hypothetical protein